MVVVNDGSTDDTLEKLIAAFKLQPARVARQVLPTQDPRHLRERVLPNLVVVDKVNGGKADALNCGLNLARYPLVCCMDADSLLEYVALLRVVRPFLEAGQVASGGVIRPLNGCTVTPMGIRGMLLPELLAGPLPGGRIPPGLSVRPGGAGVDGRPVHRQRRLRRLPQGAIVDAGGFHTDTIGEDFELVVRLHRRLREQERLYRIAWCPIRCAGPRCPSLRDLGRQRNRWQRGLLEALWRHRRMWFNPRTGASGCSRCPISSSSRPGP